MKNQELARIFERIADALELKGETGFRILAYRRAARALIELAEDVAELDAAGKLEEVPGIGSGIARKIHEYLETGRMRRYDEAIKDLPAGLFRLLDIRGMGPKTVRLMYDKLGVKDTDDLKRVIADGSLAGLPGMGDKRVSSIQNSIKTGEASGERMYLDEAFELADSVISYMKSEPHVRHATYGGSLRRGNETIGDIDVLATGSHAESIVRHFLGHPQVRQELGAGSTKASALFETRGRQKQVDLRVVEDAVYGAALQYFTGSKDHNVALRTMAQKKGLKISEYGVFRGEKRIAGRTEQEVYAAVGLPVMEPELRENRGELEAAAAGNLPRLVTLARIKSDLHVHTSLSDGAASFEEMVRAARARGYTHLAIADHSVSAHYAGGLAESALLRHCDRVDRFNARSRSFKVLKASEVDITIEGRMDYPESVLERLDLVIGSIHQGFKKNATERMCSALENPLVHCIAHPSGRLIGQRSGYDIDLEKVIEVAAKHRKILEINSFYARLDLSDIWARKAMAAGVKLAVNTDAHGVPDLEWMRYGVITARRAWLEKKDVVNCLTWRQLLALLKAIRRGRAA